MKKRFIAAIAVAALIPALAGLNHLGNKYNKEYLAECNAGNTEICAQVFDGTSANKSMITNKDHLALVADRLAEIQDNERRAAEQARKDALWQPSLRNVLMLANACENSTRPQLKDPNSFQRLGEGMTELTETHVTVYVEYTATNSYGGRVRGSNTCTYSR